MRVPIADSHKLCDPADCIQRGPKQMSSYPMVIPAVILPAASPRARRRT
jgi:hypothetical protein